LNFLVRKWEREGELSSLGLGVRERVRKAQLELVIFVVVAPSVDFRENPAPLFLLRWQNSEDRFETLAVQLALFKFSEELTYLIVQVFECKRQHLAIRDACDTKIEPCPVVVAFEEGCRVGTDPEVKAVFVDASLCPCEIAAAEFAAEYDLGVRNLPSRPLRIRL